MASTSSKHLRSLLLSESDRITNLVWYWQEILDQPERIPDDITGRIRALIGQAKLLQNDKFQQFTDLLDSFETGNPDVPMKMTVSDLEGFWDVIYIQVEDIVKKCHTLHMLKRNGWVDPAAQATLPDRVPLASISNGSGGRSSLKKSARKSDHGADARRRLAEAKLRMQRLQASGSDSEAAGPSTRDCDENRKAKHSDGPEL